MKKGFKNYLKTSSKEIQKELILFSKNLPTKEHASLRSQHGLFTQSLSGGKMLRGTLVRLGYELISSAPSKAIFRPAAAYEILHTAFLIHDDVIDKSPLRRSRPTLHNSLGGDHYGMSQAICFGDLGFFLASQLISESDFPAALKNRTLGMFSNIAAETITGEMLDIELAHKKNKLPKEEDIMTIHRLKTARYTIVGPLIIGAILAGAKQNLLDKLKIYGENLGIAFQIQDDILGVFGDENSVGKSITSDIEDGKNTLLFYFALKNSSSSQKEILNKYYGKGKIGKINYQKIRKVFEETGSLDYSLSKAQLFVDQAKKIIPLITKEDHVRLLLYELADIVVKREK